jgi:V/A-type H+-transporting ATPase subunit F
MGDAELVTAFRFIGIDGAAISNQSQAVSVFRQITENWNENAVLVLPDSPAHIENLKVLVMTEETSDWLGDLAINWQISGRYPLIVEIPRIMGRLAGRKTLVDSIREAIGLHI